ncbi:MAG: hypothetical protein AB4038_09605 [Prochloraceae cyanobacterium]
MKMKLTRSLFTLLTFSLLINGSILPVNAKESVKHETESHSATTKKPSLPWSKSKNPQVFLASLSVVGLAVLQGTGKSLKHHKSGDRKKLSAAKALAKKEQLTTNNYTNFGSVSSIEQQLVVSSQEQLRRKTYDYRQKYWQLRQQVLQSPEIAKNPDWQIDSWEIDVEIAMRVLSTAPNNFQEVKQILSQSELVREWQELLSKREYLLQSSQYIERVYQWAQQVEQWRQKQIQPQEEPANTAIVNLLPASS